MACDRACQAGNGRSGKREHYHYLDLPGSSRPADVATSERDDSDFHMPIRHIIQSFNQSFVSTFYTYHSTMSAPLNAFNLETCARPNILALEPYRCARESVNSVIHQVKHSTDE